VKAKLDDPMWMSFFSAPEKNAKISTTQLLPTDVAALAGLPFPWHRPRSVSTSRPLTEGSLPYSEVRQADVTVFSRKHARNAEILATTSPAAGATGLLL
jgi:hypothetical protein